MERTYEGHCDVCDAEIELTAREIDEQPEICPFCGSPVEYEETE